VDLKLFWKKKSVGHIQLFKNILIKYIKSMKITQILRIIIIWIINKNFKELIVFFVNIINDNNYS